MAKIIVISEEEVGHLLDLGALAESLRTAFRAVSAGVASVPPRMGAESPDGIVATMPGFVPGVGMGAKVVSYFRANHARGLPGHQAMITLFGAEDGTPRAVMGATRITAIRTAMSAAVAAEALARPGAATMAVLGAGVQGHAHVEAFSHLMDLTDIRISSRDRARADALADASPAARVVPTPEEAVRGADVVCLCTDADGPVISLDWLTPDAHVSSVGSGAEIDPATMAAAAVFVESRAAVTQPFPAGARELAGWDVADLTEVGEVLAGTHPGRGDRTVVTAYKSTGNAAEDIAAATVVYDAAEAGHVGTVVDL